VSVLTISEARASLPEVVSRAADGEEIIITRHGRPAAVLVRPDIVWSRPGAEVIMADAADLAAALGERARSHGRSLEEELRVLLVVAAEPRPAPIPPIRLATVRVGGRSTWSRSEMYGDEGR
jgi:antitoxin (DNA-binding transcriptional repressor) of toxin-antitoxin stability system